MPDERNGATKHSRDSVNVTIPLSLCRALKRGEKLRKSERLFAVTVTQRRPELLTTAWSFHLNVDSENRVIVVMNPDVKRNSEQFGVTRIVYECSVRLVDARDATEPLPLWSKQFASDSKEGIHVYGTYWNIWLPECVQKMVAGTSAFDFESIELSFDVCVVHWQRADSLWRIQHSRLGLERGSVTVPQTVAVTDEESEEDVSKEESRGEISLELQQTEDSSEVVLRMRLPNATGTTELGELTEENILRYLPQLKASANVQKLLSLVKSADKK